MLPEGFGWPPRPSYSRSIEPTKKDRRGISYQDERREDQYGEGFLYKPAVPRRFVAFRIHLSQPDSTARRTTGDPILVPVRPDSTQLYRGDNATPESPVRKYPGPQIRTTSESRARE